jgi:hypothetical protein
MNSKAPLITLAVMAAAALPVAQADAHRLPSNAHFKVRITASQAIDWKRNVQIHGQTPGCDGVVDQQGSGTAGLEMHSNGWRPVTVKRLRGQVSFSFGGPQAGTPALGHLERDGVSDATQVTAPSNPSLCPKPGVPSARDCGERNLPSNARLALRWDTPADWPDMEGPAPLVPSLSITGPFTDSPSTLMQEMGFNNCPGILGDYIFGINTNEGYQTGFAGLPISKLFGRHRSFQVNSHVKRTMPGYLPSGVTGTSPTTTELRWKVQFKRVPH